MKDKRILIIFFINHKLNKLLNTEATNQDSKAPITPLLRITSEIEINRSKKEYLKIEIRLNSNTFPLTNNIDAKKDWMSKKGTANMLIFKYFSSISLKNRLG